MKLKIVLSAIAIALGTNAMTAKEYHFTSVKGDAMQTRIYTLDNGLKVYMSVNKEKPRVQTYIAVRTGSRNDPAETTGLAHYLEHLMFKGTTHFGSSNVTVEKPLLDEIEQRFEAYRKLTDTTARKKAYHEIDSVSQLAAKYNIPNEYDKMMAAIGSEGSNAYTSNDVTCYQENIPNNEIDTWAKIQSDRFMNMVIRGFHTELEAVYEEYNIGLSSDNEKEWNAMNAKLFPKHPYGTQTTIGTQEHLKNPSITNIKNYFYRYYVPNNVAICMAGDFNPDEVIAVIDKYFGFWKKSESLSRPEYAPVPDLTIHADSSVVGQEAENIMLGWKFDKAASLQTDTLDLISNILYNGKAGIIDTDLNQPMKVLDAGCFNEGLADYSELILAANPKEGQKLEDVRTLLLAEIDKLKKGDFDNDLISSVVNNKRLSYLRALDKNNNRVEMMKDAFINGEKWEQVVGQLDRMDKITKQDVIAFANKHFSDNYVCIYKRQGVDSTQKKIDKPEITPIPTNNDKHSDFLTEIVNSKPQSIQPRFVDFDRDMTKGALKNKNQLLYKQNTDDDLFNISYVYPVGTENNNKIAAVADYLDYIGTDKYTAAQLQKEFYKLACSYSINVSANHTYINLSGLNKNMPAAMALLHNAINNAKADKDSYAQYVDIVLKGRADAKTEQRSNFYALRAYATKGSYNPVTDIMSKDELASYKNNPQKFVDELKVLGNAYTLLYYGPDDIKAFSKTANLYTGKITANKLPVHLYKAETTPENEIMIAPYNAKNIYMVQYHNENKEWNPANAALEALFNEYFGGGMNAIVFQELREARGLAYSAAAYYTSPQRKQDKEDFYTYIITQNDKMMDCIKEFNNLLNNMPQRETSLNLAKQSLLKSLAAGRTTKFGILNAYLNAKERGIDYDLNKKIYEDLPKISLQDIVNFEKQNIAQKTMRYVILGDEKNLDMKSLEKIGNIKRVSTEQIFGY